jgi:hypothetical protein
VDGTELFESCRYERDFGHVELEHRFVLPNITATKCELLRIVTKHDSKNPLCHDKFPITKFECTMRCVNKKKKIKSN